MGSEWIDTGTGPGWSPPWRPADQKPADDESDQVAADEVDEQE